MDKFKGLVIEVVKKMIYFDGRVVGVNSGDFVKEIVWDRMRWFNYEGRDLIGENYDFVWDMVGGYYDEVGWCYVSVRDYYKFI